MLSKNGIAFLFKIKDKHPSVSISDVYICKLSSWRVKKSAYETLFLNSLFSQGERDLFRILSFQGDLASVLLGQPGSSPVSNSDLDDCPRVLSRAFACPIFRSGSE